MNPEKTTIGFLLQNSMTNVWAICFRHIWGSTKSRNSGLRIPYCGFRLLVLPPYLCASEGHKSGVSIQGLINLSKAHLWISPARNIAQTWTFARLFEYSSSFYSFDSWLYFLNGFDDGVTVKTGNKMGSFSFLLIVNMLFVSIKVLTVKGFCEIFCLRGWIVFEMIRT